MANSNGWGDGAANNAIGWGQGANNAIAWGDSHAKSWAGATDIVGLTTDPDAQAFITAAAITDPTQQLAIDNLVKGLKSDNIWTKMKAIYPFVGGTATTHKYNLKDPRDLDAAFRLVFNGGWTHSPQGATPNGVNGYADTKLNIQNNLNQDSIHLSYYSRTNSNATEVEIGAQSGSFQTLLELRTAGTTYFVLNQSTPYVTYADVDSRAFYIANRTASNVINGWKNSIKVATGITATIGEPNLNLYIGAYNLSNTTANFSTKQTAFSSIGDGLTDTEAANLYTRVQAYQTALSRQV